MYLFYNNNPNGLKIGDCVIRAISAALNETWERIYIDLCIEGFLLKDLPNSNAVWDSYLKYKGYKRYAIPDTCPDCYTIAQFAEEHPKGTYILATGSHVVCVENGVIKDNWDSSDEIPIYYYKRENKE